MRRALAFLVLLGLIAYGVLWIAAMRETSKVAKAPWPGDLGSLESLAQRFPRQAESASAKRLIELAEPLKIDAIHPFLQAYVNAEMERGELAIAEPPAEAAAYLVDQAIAIVAIREHLVSRGSEVAWARDLSAGYEAPTPNLPFVMKLTRMLVANALARARNGDAGAWTDLQAARNLSRSLHGHPELVTQIVALATERMINAASWKLPLPAPPWIEDGADYVRIFQRSMQYDQWLLWRHRAGGSPLRRLEVADTIERQLETARRIDRSAKCDFEGREVRGYRNLVAAWRRAFRYRVEREAVRNAMRARAGAQLAGSRCGDGAWTFDGSWLRFSRDIAAPEPAMPLALRVR